MSYCGGLQLWVTPEGGKYWRLAYRFNKKLDMRVNVLNVFNKDYYTAVYRSGAFLYKGAARAVRLTLNSEL